MKLSQVYFLSITLCKISKGDQNSDGEVAPTPTLFHNSNDSQVNSEDNSETNRRPTESSSATIRRSCFNVSLQMKAMVL